MYYIITLARDYVVNEPYGTAGTQSGIVTGHVYHPPKFDPRSDPVLSVDNLFLHLLVSAFTLYIRVFLTKNIVAQTTTKQSAMQLFY